MATPHVARGRAITPELSEREALLDRLAHLVATCDDHGLLARLVTDLEDATNSSLGPAFADSTPLLARRFARAHRHIITAPSTATAAQIRFWIAEYDGGFTRRPESHPLDAIAALHVQGGSGANLGVRPGGRDRARNLRIEPAGGRAGVCAS
jgi:hypothetical protein